MSKSSLFGDPGDIDPLMVSEIWLYPGRIAPPRTVINTNNHGATIPQEDKNRLLKTSPNRVKSLLLLPPSGGQQYESAIERFPSVNRFFSSVVWLQLDRGHVVCDSGLIIRIEQSAKPFR